MQGRTARRALALIAVIAVVGAVAWIFFQATVGEPAGPRPIKPPKQPPPTPTPRFEEPPLPAPSEVRIVDGALMVDGAPFPVVQCVGYQPIPVGVSPSYGYKWADEPEGYERDLPLLVDLGANVVAVNTRSASSVPALRHFMTQAYAHGIKVILVLDGPKGRDASAQQTQDEFLREVREVAQAYASHPALLAWQLGVEVDYRYRDPARVGDWYVLLERAAVEMQTLDPNHPVLTGNNPTTAPEPFRDLSPSVPIYGTNYYALTRGNMERYLSGLPDVYPGRAVLVTEFGTDAYDSANRTEDEATQARVLLDVWDGILAAREAGAPVLGGCIHEWRDQWWKDGDAGRQHPLHGWAVHEKGVLPDDTLSEEWFGLTRIGEDGDSQPRAAYHALARVWRAHQGA